MDRCAEVRYTESMKTHRHPTIAAVLLALLLAATSSESLGQQVSRADLYRSLLELRVTDLGGRTWTHERLQGRIVLIDFWATWCAPCLRELPYLQEARERYGDRFEVPGINLDTFLQRQLQSWLDSHAIVWPQVHATGGYDDSIALKFGVYRLPTNLLIDKHGRLRAVDVRREQLFVEVDRLLAEQAVPQ